MKQGQTALDTERKSERVGDEEKYKKGNQACCTLVTLFCAELYL